MGFDINQANAIFNVASNRDPVSDILQTQFGVPECVLNLSQDVLSLLPTSPLNQINKSIEKGKQRAQDKIKEIKRKIFRELGVLEVGTEQGVIGLFSQINDAILGEGGKSFLEGLGALGEMFGAAAAVWGEVVTPILDKVDEAAHCLDLLQATEALKKSNSALAKDYINSDLASVGLDVTALQNYEVDYATKYASERQDLINTMAYVAKAQIIQNEINQILDNRFNDPEKYPEPCFAADTMITQPNGAEIALKYITSGTDFCVVDPEATGYCSLGQAYTNKNDCEAVGGIWTQIDPKLLPQASFSVKPTELDPPISRVGKFILTNTGIYYDTVGGGLELPNNLEELVECSSIIPDTALRWMFEYDPNCGGKGESVTLAQFNKWANTVFDIEAATDIEEAPGIQAYYKNDTMLQQIIGERNRHLYDLSSYVGDLITSGYATDSALVLNQKQQIQAANSRHENKVKRRKKQIQIGVIFGDFAVGEIPINDFTFLQKHHIDIALEKQEKLVFNPGEVSSVVLPLDTQYSIVREKILDTVYLDHLLVGEVGRGSIVTAASSVAATAGTVLSLTDNITTEGLIACYNFLEGNVEVDPDSSRFEVTNTADKNNVRYNAQIVASSFDTVYPSGVGIVQFQGICNFFSGIGGVGGNSKAGWYEASAQYLQAAYRPMSYMRLPNGVDDFESLLYRNSGFSFETWVHMPTLITSGAGGWDESVGASSLHRIILGNENRGGFYYNENVEILTPNKDSESVLSLLMGFTRDRRFTKNLPPSEDSFQNPIDDDLKFYMAPTQAVNTSAITFIRRPGPDGECHPQLSTGQRYVGLVLDASATDTDSGERIGDCSSSFKLLTVTADPADEGTVSIYCNGVKLKSQNFITTFGFKGPPNIPGPLDPSSFVYSNIYKDNLPINSSPWIASSISQKDFWYFDGPDSGGFTPWIIGSGYSDGMTNIDFGYPNTSDEGMNFMGTSYGGRRSGLNGMLGSIKLYKRALKAKEVLKNYTAQKGFFENIEI